MSVRFTSLELTSLNRSGFNIMIFFGTNISFMRYAKLKTWTNFVLAITFTYLFDRAISVCFITQCVRNDTLQTFNFSDMIFHITDIWFYRRIEFPAFLIIIYKSFLFKCRYFFDTIFHFTLPNQFWYVIVDIFRKVSQEGKFNFRKVIFSTLNCFLDDWNFFIVWQ